MADPEETLRQSGVPPDGRPRRPPPTIDVEAVEVSQSSAPSAAAGATADAARQPSGWLTRLAVTGPIVIAVAIGAGVAWVYLMPERGESPQRDAAGSEAGKL